MSARKKAAESPTTLLESLAAVECDTRDQLHELTKGLGEFPGARCALERAYGLAVSTRKAILMANAMKATGADANSALQAAARLIAAELTVPPEPEPGPDSDDRMVAAIESVAAEIAAFDR